jgi:hypothetical protein
MFKGIWLAAILTPFLNYSQPLFSQQPVTLDAAHSTSTYVSVLPQVNMVGTPTGPFHPTIASRVHDLDMFTPTSINSDPVYTSTSTIEADEIPQNMYLVSLTFLVLSHIKFFVNTC